MRIERVLITGCGGMLGSAIYPFFIGKYKHVLASDKELTEPWLMELDVRDDARLEQVFREFRPNIVLHLAAETNLEYCELNAGAAEATNTRATETIAKLCTAHDASLVYISTAGVFDGLKDGFYIEDDQPRPIMVYGRTKYDGELLATANCPRTFVVRAGWMMGGGKEKEKKFIYKILQQIKEGRQEIFAVDDLWGTPTYTHDFAMNLFSLLDTRRYGTYHMVCEGAGTRHDVAKQILKVCRRNDIRLTPVTSDFFSKEYFVQRPRSEMMINSNLRKIGCHQMRGWNTALREYIERYFDGFIANPTVSKHPRDVVRKGSFTEKRRQARKPVDLGFSYMFQSDQEVRTFCGKSVDISATGLCLITDHALPPQSLITLHASAGEYWRQAAMVRWSEKSDSAYRIGMKFLIPSSKMAEMAEMRTLSLLNDRNSTSEIPSPYIGK